MGLLEALNSRLSFPSMQAEILFQSHLSDALSESLMKALVMFRYENSKKYYSYSGRVLFSVFEANKFSIRQQLRLN